MYVNLFEQALNNKLLVVEINDIKFVFSYDSLVGFIYNNVFFIDVFYKNYSNTTNKHLSYIKNDYKFVYVDTYLFDKIVKYDMFEQAFKSYTKCLSFLIEFEQKLNSFIYYSIDVYDLINKIVQLNFYKDFNFVFDVEQTILTSQIKETIKINSNLFNSFNCSLIQYKTLKKEQNKNFNIKINFDKIKKEFVLKDLI